eukprot:2679146-Rhodomonas_salina.3
MQVSGVVEGGRLVEFATFGITWSRPPLSPYGTQYTCTVRRYRMGSTDTKYQCITWSRPPLSPYGTQHKHGVSRIV